MPKKFKGVDAVVRMAAPKAVTVGINILQMGPRVIFRSAVQLLRANLFTRILSCMTLLLLDLADLSRRRISKVQFARNILLSLILVASGTFGWYAGSRWLVLEMLGSAVEIVGGMIGAGVFGTVSGVAFDRICSKYIKSDAQQMWDIINTCIADLPGSEQAAIRAKINSADLKKMFACEDRQVYARDLIKKAGGNHEVG